MKKARIERVAEVMAPTADKPVLVTTIETEQGQALAPITPGLQHNDRTIDRHLGEVERMDGGDAMKVEDVIDIASAYPPEDVDPAEPVDERQLRMAGLLIEYGLADRAGMKKALSSALKHLRLKGDLKKYDQRVSGRSSDALNAIAGARHGYRPARLLYRLAYQTRWERWWTTFGHDDTVTFLRFLRPGPKVRAEDVSYWMVIRGAWQCLRPVNGVLTVQINPDIPTDAHPEETLGDDWKVLEGLPQQRIGDKVRQAVKNDVDLLFTALGHRHPRGRGNLMFGEWVDVAMGSRHASAKPKEEDDKDDEDKPLAGLRTLVKFLAVFGGVIGLAVGLLAFAQRM